MDMVLEGRDGAPSRVQARSRFAWNALPWTGAAVALCVLALFVRIMAYPLEHDEQFYIPPGVLFSWGGLYDELGFSHFPNFPLLLSLVSDLFGTGHFLLTGRLILFGAWLGLGAALLLIGRRYCGGGVMTALMVALIAFNPAFLEETGMAATNNFVPIPFAMFGIYAFFRAAEADSPSPVWAAASGALLALAAGFKANYAILIPPFAVAAFLVPFSAPFTARLSRLALPMLLGGLAGGAPTLFFFLQDAQGFVAHTYAFHKGPQIAYWNANVDPLDPKAMGLRDKYLLASEIWFASARVALALAIAFLIILAASRERIRMLDWRVLTLVAVTGLAGLAAFLPTPAFPQYYTLPLPFAIVLAGLLHGQLNEAARVFARPFVIAALAVTALTGAPMLFKDLPALASPQRWTGIRVHEEAERLAALTQASDPIVTLAPLFALEGGRRTAAGLALGPFVYRAADWIPAAERRHYRDLVSPTSVGAMLERSRPNAILIGSEGKLDQPLADFARSNGYEARALNIGGTRAILFLRPKAPFALPPAAADAAAAVRPAAARH